MMSKYTIELGEMLRLGYNVSLEHYPLFCEEYRATLNQKIIDHYYFREIGVETPDKFNFYLTRKLNEIMPYYNQMYKSTLLEYNPLATMYLETEEKTNQTRNNTEKNSYKLNRDFLNTNGYKQTDSGNSTQTTDYGKTITNTGHKQDKGGSETTESGSDKNTGDISFKKGGTIKEDITTTYNTNVNTLKTDNTQTNVNGSDSQTYYDLPNAVTGANGELYLNSPTTLTNNTNNQTTKNTGTTTTDEKKTGNDTNNKTITNNTTDTQTNNTTLSKTKNAITHNANEQTQDNNETHSGTDKTTNDENFTKTNSGVIIENTDENNSENKKAKSKLIENIYRTVTGRTNMPPADLLLKWRDTFVNIDMMIIDELNDLFMCIY